MCLFSVRLCGHERKRKKEEGAVVEYVGQTDKERREYERERERRKKGIYTCDMPGETCRQEEKSGCK